ncbi:MAG: ABC transporter permease [bacterium]|nr:ABC transporter permease [bacterium]
MIKYTLRRILQAIPTFFGITLFSYLLMTAAPGGPEAALTFDPRITPQQREREAARLGVNDPFIVQYLRWLTGNDWMRWDTDGGTPTILGLEGTPVSNTLTTRDLPDGIADGSVLIPLGLDANGDGDYDDPGDQIYPPGNRYGIIRGDFGRSFFYNRPVMSMIGERVAATLELGIAALVTGLIIGVPVGILAAVRRGGWFDNLTRILAVIFNAIPIFWLALILILIFGARLGWLPMAGRTPRVLEGGIPPIYERIQYLILPTFVLATGAIAVYSRYMRASMLDVISQDYMRTAKSKGLASRAVWFRHGARNALIPLATFLGPAITSLLSGAAITETVFGWPGLGRFGVEAVTAQDFPVVMAVVIIGAVATLLGYMLSDVMYALIDPRIRFD